MVDQTFFNTDSNVYAGASATVKQSRTLGHSQLGSSNSGKSNEVY